MSNYYKHVVYAIHRVLSNAPNKALPIEEIAARTGYSKSYIHQHLMWIRRDDTLDWNVSFLGHGNTGPVRLQKREEIVDILVYDSYIVGFNSWRRTAENKCISIVKELEYLIKSTNSEATKDMLGTARLHMLAAKDMIKKAI
jgi:hypothetical protein